VCVCLHACVRACVHDRVHVILKEGDSGVVLGSHTVSVRALWNGRRVCRLSRVRSRKLSEIRAKFHHLYRKSGSLSKNMTSHFAPDVAKYTKSILPQQQFQECASLLFQSVSDAACWICCHLFMTCLMVFVFVLVVCRPVGVSSSCGQAVPVSTISTLPALPIHAWWAAHSDWPTQAFTSGLWGLGAPSKDGSWCQRWVETWLEVWAFEHLSPLICYYDSHNTS